MEKLKAKHDHKLTDILKVAIFGIFLILPFMVYAPNALYYGVNEYAVAQEKIKEENTYYQSNEVNNFNDLYIGNIYEFNYKENQPSENNAIKFSITKLVPLSYQSTSTSQSTSFQNNVVSVFNYSDRHYFRYFYVENGQSYYTDYFNFSGLIVYDNNVTNQDVYTYLSYTNQKIPNGTEEVTYTMSIAESMNTAWQQTWETPMFNWTSESVLKQGLDNFTGVFGVSDTSYFTNLIVYELIMVAIYIVIDIVITMFKWLTHLIGEK